MYGTEERTVTGKRATGDFYFSVQNPVAQPKTTKRFLMRMCGSICLVTAELTMRIPAPRA